MFDWDLSSLKQKHLYVENTSVICDLGTLSAVVSLSHSTLSQNEKLKISVAGYIEETPWLNAKLRNTGTSEELLQYELSNKDHVEIVLECSREPTEDEIAQASKKQFMFSVTLVLMENQNLHPIKRVGF
jgi:hypothetical protein